MTDAGRRRSLRPDPLWRKAPLALFRDRWLLGAVACATGLLALAAAASPLFVRAVGNAAFASKVSALTPFGAGLVVSVDGLVGTGAPPAPDVVAAAGAGVYATPFVRDPIVTEVTAPVETDRPGRAPSETSPKVRLMARTGALAHVDRLAGQAGSGVWIADTVARALHLEPGDELTLAGDHRVSVRVDGIYRALWKEPAGTAYWINFAHDIYAQGPAFPPPPTFMFANPDRLESLYRAVGGGRVQHLGEFTVEPGLTLDEARIVEANFEEGAEEVDAQKGCGPGFGLSGCQTSNGLRTALIEADVTTAAVTPLATLLAAAGILIALGVVAASGAYSVARRRVEAQLLFARGERASTFAARAALEAVLPALVGTAVGLGLAVGIVRLFGSSGTIDASGLRAAGTAAATPLPVGLLLLAAVAGFAFRRQFDVGRPRAPWLRRVPWELALLGLAAYLYLDLSSGGLVGGGAAGVVHPSLAVFLFPIVSVAAVAALVARLLRWRLRRLGPRGAALPVSVYLALRRLAAGRGLVALLVTAGAISLGAFLYAQALVATLDRSARVKAHVVVGSDFQALVNEGDTLPPDSPYPLTKVALEYAGASLASPAGPDLDLLVIDPPTFSRAVFWDPTWRPLVRIMQGLERSGRPGVLPVVVAGARLPALPLFTDAGAIRVRTVATVPAFPGMTAKRPLVVTTYDALDRRTRRTGLPNPIRQGSARSYVWGKGPAEGVEGALRSSGVTPYYVVTAASVLAEPDIAAETRSFGFLRALGIAAGLLAVVGLVLYLQTRQRSRILASALSRRMGLRGRLGALAISLELGGALLVAYLVGGTVSLAAARLVLPHVDPLANLAPPPLFRTPLGAVAFAAAGLLVVAVLGGGLAQRAASRGNLADVIRRED